MDWKVEQHHTNFNILDFALENKDSRDKISNKDYSADYLFYGLREDEAIFSIFNEELEQQSDDSYFKIKGEHPEPEYNEEDEHEESIGKYEESEDLNEKSKSTSNEIQKASLRKNCGRK